MKDYRKLWNYNCNDCLSQFESMKKLEREIDFYGFRKTFEFEMEVTREMYEIGRRGILIDDEIRHQKLLEANKTLTGMTKEFQEITGIRDGEEVIIKERVLKSGIVKRTEKIKVIEGFNPKSSVQVKKYLKSIGITLPVKKEKDGNERETTDENALKKLALKYPENEFIRLMMKHRKLAKLIDTYLTMKLDYDKVCRSMYGWTENGRLSCRESQFGTGLNVQQIPRKEMEF